MKAAGSAATSSFDLNSGKPRSAPRAARFHRAVAVLAVAWCLTASPPPSAAQSAEAPGVIAPLEGRRITAVTIDTTSPFGADDLRRLTGIAVGASVDAGAIRASLDRLHETGLFSAIAVEAEETADGAALTYRLAPKQWIRELKITGPALSFSSSRLRGAMRLAAGDEFIREQWQGALARLVLFYTREGYFQARLTPIVAVQPDGASVHLHITVDEGPRALIDRLTLQGQLGLAEKRVRKELALDAGAPYSAVELDRRILALQQTYEEEGFLLATIDPPAARYVPEANRVAVAITVRAGPVVAVRVAGNPYWSDQTLDDLLLIRTERSVEDDVLEASALRIQHHLREEAYLTATVAAARDGAPTDERVIVTFRIEAGPRFDVGRLTIVGLTAFDRSELLDHIRMRPALLGDPRFDLAKWDNDVERIRRYYRERGFLDAAVEGSQQLRPDEAEVDLTLAIDEGARTIVAAIAFSGQDHLPEPLLRRSITSRVGEPYNPAQARSDRLALLALYAGKGYVQADVAMEPILNESRTEAALHFTIREEAPAFVGQIVIEGNEQTDEAVIRRELLIHPADPYDYERILRSRYRVARLGLFSSVRLEPIDAEASGPLKDLRLSVIERPAGALEFGIGFATEEKLRGFAQLSYRNLAGTGRRISLRTEADFIEQHYSITYTEPWFLGLPVDLRLTALYEVVEEVTFDRRTYGATAVLDKQLTERLKVSLLYRFTKNHFTLLVDESLLPQDARERVNIGSVTPALFLDFRDDPFNPARGSFHGVAFEDAALLLGSEVQFVKVTAFSSWFFNPHPLVVLAFSGRAGGATQFGETLLVPLSERFYLGGRSTVRGYKQDTLGVARFLSGTNTINPEQSTLTQTGEPIGGNVMLLANVEIRLALPKHFGLVLFLDGGNVWQEITAIQAKEIKFSTGAGLRYNTPIGPLRLDWGYKLNRETFFDESKYEVHFTLGHVF